MWLLFLQKVQCIEVTDLESGELLCRHSRTLEPDSGLRISSSPRGGLSEHRSRRYDVLSDGDVSVALPADGAEPEQGRVFSRLPLDIKSGMAAHVSALFWTSADRRTIVLDAEKDLLGWAQQNMAYLQRISRCLVSCVAHRAAHQKRMPLNLFPHAEQPSPAAELLHSVFYDEVIRQYRDASEHTVLRNLAGEPVQGLRILLTQKDGWPGLLQRPEIPLVCVTAQVMHALLRKDDRLFCELTPFALREWLRAMPQELDQHCDDELLRYCLQDEACGANGLVAEDLVGCPLLLTADGRVRRFLVHEAKSPQILCCANKDEWDLARHFPAENVWNQIQFVPESFKVLSQHGQICSLCFKSAAVLGKDASGQDFATSFWHWYDLRVAQETAEEKLPNPPGETQHILENLVVLPTVSHDGSSKLLPLWHRRGGLLATALGPESELAQGLGACEVLLVQQTSACPHISPDAVVRAAHWAVHKALREGRCLDPRRVAPNCWRAVLQELARSQLAEAVEVARILPAFQDWDGQGGQGLCLPDKPLFPPRASRQLRELLRSIRQVKLEVLLEEDMNVLALLKKMGTAEMPLDVLALKALEQTHDIRLVAQLLRENLGSVLKGKPVLPVQGSTSSDGVCLKAPEECLLWDCELGFSHIPRRISASEGEVFSDLQGRLVELGCRTELNEADVLDVASQVEKEQDEGLALKLLSRLEKHPHMTQICKGTSLRRIAWLPCSVQAERVLMAPEKCPWQRGALQLVGKVRPIVSVQANPDLLAALGVLGPDAVEDGVLHEQLAALIQDDSAADDVTPVYRKLKSVPSLEKWVWTRHGFQALGRVSKDPDVQALAPVLQVLRDEWHDLPAFRAVNSKLTPQELFLAMDLAAPMHNITAEDAHQVHMAAIRLLTKYRDADGSYPNLAELARAAGSELRVPGKHSMVPVAKTFFQDMRWHSTSPPAGMEEVHGGMSRDDCARLGVPNLSEILAKECSCADEDWLEVTGQHEPLTRRLKNILKDYPWQALVKEMLQNAEDAGAGRFKVLIDRRSRGTESLLTPEMADQQGPCIWFYNDAVFEDKDFQALVSLGQGSKAGEKGKIGRHGLGFNAIFNITDVPSILSREHLGMAAWMFGWSSHGMSVLDTYISTCPLFLTPNQSLIKPCT